MTTPFIKGMRDAVPIGAGYMAVAFSLGITARCAGLSPSMGFLSSLLTRASAGEYAVYALMGAGAAYIEVFAVCFIANLRYLLMGASLSQKFASDMPIWKRIMASCCITDEIFGISIAWKGNLSAAYPVGATVLAGSMWGVGTALGIAAGNILPQIMVSALSVALYGMFIAIIIPPARRNKALLLAVIGSFLLSWLLGILPGFSGISAGMRTVILTIAISTVAAILKPVNDADDDGAAKDRQP